VTLSKVLIANRGEIAIRIARAAASCGLDTVAIFAAVDAQSLHIQMADQALQLPGDGVAAYLDVAAVVAAAQSSGCDCVHPGYGFLSENAELAIACAKAGLTFVGPSADALGLFGDKLQARALAKKLGIAVLTGSEGALTTLSEAQAVAAQVGYPIMLKAAAGGGGRGMREVFNDADLADAFERSASEAEAAFGRGDIFVERLVAHPKHIEVQVLGDSQGNLIHLYERDCSVQLRHQKVLEFAPAPNLDAKLREQILAAAVQLASAVGYANAGTVEFLVDPETEEFFFIECNPRIQVEHTVTEQVLGLDLVSCQFAIAGGASLASLGFPNQAAVPTPRGYAVQARVVAQGAGTITSYKEPAGAGVRVDACGYLGCTPPSEFDPLLAKVICTAPVGATFASAVQLTLAALQQYQVAGLATNLVQLQNVLRHPSVAAGDARTTLLRDTPELLDVVAPKASGALVFLQQQATLVSSS
jgi:pyruvate carboxylase